MNHRLPIPPRLPHPRHRARGFTLMELMVSIALVLIIILGVNTVFRITSDTVNAGTAMQAADRENRAIQGVLFSDIQTGTFTNGPCLVIRSERMSAFRNAQDAAADRDGNALTIDLDGNNAEGDTNVPGERVPPTAITSRSHRLDRMMFFANHLFRRQTGGAGSFIDDESSNEAYVWYGHLAQPSHNTAGLVSGTNSATGVSFFNPGVTAARGSGSGTNNSNLHATDWILGRSVTLLLDPPRGAATSPPVHNYIRSSPMSSGANLTPLSPPSRSGDSQFMSWSRYDVAQTSTAAFRDKLIQYISLTSGSPSDERWWNLLSNERFVGYPFPDRPLSPYRAAWTAPIFVRGCTQFIVEYAGDYLAQNPEDGEVQRNYYQHGPAGTDGQVDYVMVSDRRPDLGGGGNTRVRRVRWYGFPRNVDTTGEARTGPVISASGNDPGNFFDVIPLRDVLIAEGVTPDPDTFFEKFSGTFPTTPPANYAASAPMATATYVVAWGPGDLVVGSLTKPKMLRITVVVDDPNGRLSEGQVYEYVIDLP